MADMNTAMGEHGEHETSEEVGDGNNHSVNGNEETSRTLKPRRGRSRKTVIRAPKRTVSSRKKNECTDNDVPPVADVNGTVQLEELEIVEDNARLRGRKRPKMDKFECDRCGLTSKQESQHLKHRETCQTAQTTAPLKCGYCELILIGKDDSSRHFLINHSGLDSKVEETAECHECPLCSKEYASLNSWLAHVQNHTLEKLFECAICHKKFSNPNEFQSHVMIHPLERSYACSLCPETFALPLAKESHVRNHSQYQCKLCTNIYKYQKTLQSHMRRIHGEGKKKKEVGEEAPVETENEGEERREELVEEEKKETEIEEDDAAVLDDDRDKDWSQNGPENGREKRTRRAANHNRVNADTDDVIEDFPCDLCDKVFPSKKARREHFAKDHNGAISCIPCNLTFSHRRGLRRHRIRCHGPKTNSWVCEVCGKAFDCTYALSTHRRVHFAPKKHACGVCGMKFQRAENMRRHEARHSGSKAFMCDVCGACYTTKFILQKHAEIHVDSSDKVFLCDTCGEGFSRPNVLKWHMQSDCGKKSGADRPMGAPSRGRVPGVQSSGSRQMLPFPCPMCKKGFKEQEILDRHIKGFHTNDESLICDECGIRFRTEATLNTHKAIHTSLKHKCSYCNKEFLRETLKAIHEREKHTGDKPFKCKFCDESFSRKGKLSAHQLIHYGREISCEYCGMLFAKVDTKMKHMKKHTNQRPYVCNLCSKAFKEKYNLEIHMRTHSNQKAFVCKTCGKRYSEASGLKNHMRSHDQTGNNQFQCDICDQRFSTSEGLVTHTESHTEQGQTGDPVMTHQQEVTHTVTLPVTHTSTHTTTHTATHTNQIPVQALHAQVLNDATLQIQTFDLNSIEQLQSQQLVQQQQLTQQLSQQQVQQQQQVPVEQRAFEIHVLDQLQRPQQFSLDQLQRVQTFTPDQLVVQRPPQFTVDNLQQLQRPQMALMDAYQRPQLWNLNL